jgi:hypothetical protein
MGGLGAAALVLGSNGLMSQTSGYGELVPDPGGVIDLPPRFKYRIISEEGSTLSSGAPVPGDHDGISGPRRPPEWQDAHDNLLGERRSYARYRGRGKPPAQRDSVGRW